MKNIKIAFLTLGCKVNKYETDILKQECIEAGMELVDFDQLADVYCINSCTVTNISQRKTRQMISKARLKNKEACVAVIGCGATSEDIQDGSVDLMLDNKNKMNFVFVLKNYLSKKQTAIDCLQEMPKEYDNDMCLRTPQDVRQAIKIEDGCNNFCSYCVIPYVRGRVRSRSLESIEREVEYVSKHGAYEIVLVGIEIASYGIDIQDGVGLINVIERLNGKNEVKQIRLSSLEPRFLSKENIQRLHACKKVCPHFHISMQSGSDEILKAMNRKYTSNDLIRICKDIHNIYENVYIAADVIVGFPGEKESNYNETMDTIKQMELNELHVFKYSKRKNTRASTMTEQIDGVTKHNRSQQLINMSNTFKEQYMSKYINKEITVLFECYKNGILNGITKNYVKVQAKGDKSLCGTTQDVVVTSLKNVQLQGKILKKT